MNLRKNALTLIKKGLFIFPIAPGKTLPLVKFSETSSNEFKIIDRIWRTDHSKKNIGIHTGNGLVVLDLDVHADGFNSFLKLAHEHNEGFGLPETFAVSTPSGGAHYYFTTEKDIRNSAGKLGKGLDIRGHNGFVVGPGSIRKATDKKLGGEYKALNNLALTPFPKWLEDLCLAEKTPPQTNVSYDSDAIEALEDVPYGQRNERLFKEACGLRGKGWKRDAILAAIIARNKTFTQPLTGVEIELIGNQASKYSPNESLYDQTLKRSKKSTSTFKKRSDTPETSKRNITLRQLSTYKKRTIAFLWRGLFPLSSVSIIAGDPGQAKTSFMLNLAANITQGLSPLKNASKTKKGSVVFATAEDSIEHTVHPRLEAAGGDPKKFFVVDNVDFNILEDYEKMCDALEKIGDVRLLIIDPITAYMGKDADGNSNTDVRITLRCLTDLAERNNLAVVGISHLNKDTKKSVYARLLGSIGWVAAPRAVYLINENPEAPGQSVMACAKTNFIEPEPVAFRKEVVAVMTEEGLASQVVTAYEDYVGGLSIEELFASKDKKMTKTEQAREWLQKRLSGGDWILVRNLKAEVKREGLFSWRTVQSAEKKLVIEKHKDPPPGGWSWRIVPMLPSATVDTSAVFT